MARPTLAVAVQAHPRRRDLAEALLERLGERAQIVWDPEPDGRPSPWRTYRRCIESAPADATHLLVIQEDATPCDGFRAVIENIVAARPDRVVVLCVTGNPARHRLAVQTACQRGESWAELSRGHWLPLVAVIWPVELAHDLLSWVDEQTYPLSFTADDEICGRYLTARGLFPCAVVPSLVDHEDLVPSVTSRRRRNGANPGRQAFLFIDKHCDQLAAEIDWGVGPGG